MWLSNEALVSWLTFSLCPGQFTHKNKGAHTHALPKLLLKMPTARRLCFVLFHLNVAENVWGRKKWVPRILKLLPYHILNNGIVKKLVKNTPKKERKSWGRESEWDSAMPQKEELRCVYGVEWETAEKNDWEKVKSVIPEKDCWCLNV